MKLSETAEVVLAVLAVPLAFLVITAAVIILEHKELECLKLPTITYTPPQV